MIRIECPITACGFEHLTDNEVAAADGLGHVLPDGTLLPSGSAAARGDRVGTHLRLHTVEDWIGEVLRLRDALSNPDGPVGAAREAQQLALVHARRVKDERDAARAEAARLRGQLAALRTGPAVGRPQRVNPTAPCPVCSRDFLLRTDGRIRLHNQLGKSQACAGSHALIDDPAPAAA